MGCLNVHEFCRCYICLAMKRLLLYIFFLFISIAANAQLSFSIRVGSRSIGKDQSLQVEYAVTNADALSEFAEPVFSDWEVLSGPMYSQQQMITNGKVDKTTSYIYILQPKRLGTLILPGTTVVAGNKKLQCVSIRITVTKQPSSAPTPSTQNLPSLFDELTVDPQDRMTISPGERIEDKIKQSVFIRAEANKTKCYAGEPILVTYKLYTALRPELQVNKQPAFSGASVIELPFDDFPQNATINGKQYRVYTFRRVQLTPLQTGTLTLEPASVKATLEYVMTHERTMRNSTVMIVNLPVTITVVPPPMLNGKEFDGPIGQFSLALKADNDTLPADATNNLIIELSGEGNFQNLRTPQIKWPAAIQHYEESSSEELNKQNFPVQGRKLIKIPFVANAKGRIEFLPVEVTVFNPALNQFETLTSNSLQVLITDAVKTSTVTNNVYDNISNKKYLWLIPAIALLVGFIFIITNKKQRKTVTVKKEETAPAPVAEPEPMTQPLNIIDDQLIKLENQWHQREWLSTARQVLKDAVLYHGEKISTHEFVILEKIHHEKPELFNRYTSLLKTMNEALYAPIPIELNRNEIIGETRSIVKELVNS
jgi:hypothetical protein